MSFGRSWRASITLLLLVGGFACSVFAAPVHTITLENGFTVHLKSVPSANKTLDLRLMLAFGAADERAGERGWAHLVEHMAFNGTERFSARQIRDLFQRGRLRFGRDVNAATDEHYTVYQLSVHEGELELLEQSLELIADWLSDMRFSAQDLSREKRIIAAETLETMAQRDAPANWQEVLLQLPAQEHAAIGLMEQVNQATPESLRAFWRRGYRPAAATLLLTGDFIPAQAVALVHKVLAPLAGAAQTPNDKQEQARPPVALAVARTAYEGHSGKQVMLASLAVGEEQKQRSALAMMALQLKLLDGHQSLACGTVQRRLLSLSAEAELHFLQRSTHQGQEIACLGVMTRAVQRLQREGVPKEFAMQLFHRIQSERQKHQAMEHSIDVHTLAKQIEQRLRKGASALTTADRLTELSDWVGAQDPQSIADSVLSALQSEDLSLVVQSATLPGTVDLRALWRHTDAPQTASAADLKYRLSEPASQSPIEVLEQSPRQRSLHYANGVRVHLLKTDNIHDHFDVLLVREGGLLSLPSTLVAAAARLPEALQYQGLSDRTAAMVQAGLREHSLTLDWFVENFRQGIRASSRGHGAEALFSMLYQSQLALPEPAYQEIQGRQQQREQSSAGDGSRQLRREIWRALYGLGDPLLPPAPVELDAESFRSAHQRLFAGATSLSVYIAGDFDFQRMARLSDKYFGGLAKSESNTVVPGLYASAKRQRIVHRGNTPTRADLSFYYVQSASNKLERFDAELLLMREVLAQRLWRVLREREGLSYDVRLQLQRRAYRRGGSSLKVSMVCDPSLAVDVRQHVDEVLLSLLVEGVDAEELQTLSRRLSLDYQTLLGDNATLLDEWANQRERGRSLVQVLHTVAEIEAVDAERLQQFARLFFKETGFLEVDVVPGLQASLAAEQAAFVTEP